MRLTIAITMLTIFQLHATTTFGQRINYVQKDVSLVDLFKEIKKQTGYNIIWNEDKLNLSKTIDVNFQNAPLQEVLESSLKGMSISYAIASDQKSIIIKYEASSFLDKALGAIQSKTKDLFQSIDVQGTVVDDQGLPLAGASVKVKGTNRSTKTNAEGNFSLTGIAENAILVITYLGYQEKEIAVAVNLGKIMLETTSGDLKEVEINAGYYTVKDRERTGSISRIAAETIEMQPVNNPLMALVGRIPGLQITQQTGVPGGSLTVQIRGRNSISRGNDPLYIIDGVNYSSVPLSTAGVGNILANSGTSPLSMINPGDIENIEVLKDADATAIYGSRGANGVILITTKKSKSEAVKVNVSLSQGFSRVPHKIDLLNTEEYLEMRREAYRNDGLPIEATAYDINGTYKQDRYTDWQKELIGGTSGIINSSLNITGGTGKSNYLISGNYYKEGTVFPGDFGFSRVSFRSSLNFGAIEDRFNASFTATYNHTKSNLSSTDPTSYILLPPNAPDPYDEYGKLTWQNNTVIINPISYLLKSSDAAGNNLISNLTLSYRILKGMMLKSAIGYSTITKTEVQKNPLASVSPFSTSYTATGRTSNFADIYYNSLNFEPIITYNTKLWKGKIESLLGMSFQNNNSQQRSLRGSNFTSDDLMGNISSASVITSNFNTLPRYRYIATFARINYSFSNKLFLNVTARRDGSSRFGQDKQFSNFGALGAGWIFSDEKYIREKLPFLNFGKLRTSYGVTGNDQIPDYGYLQVWNPYETYQGNATIAHGPSAPNADFSWEINKKLEAAIQLGFIKTRLNIEISYYNNYCSNQLLNKFLPLSTGLSAVVMNLPAKVQNTGLEFNADFNVLRNSALHWTVSMNFTRPKNKLLSYPELEKTNDAVNYKVGEPLDILKVYNVIVDSQTGLYAIEDNNANGTRDNSDRYLIKYIGRNYYGGLQNSFKYRAFNFDFNWLVVNQNGNSYQSATSQTAGAGLPVSTGSLSNQFSKVLDRWQKPGDETNTQKYTTTSVNRTLYSTAKLNGNLAIADASFIRLQNISLTYSFPQSVLSRLKISNMGISLQGQNILTITNYIGLDPETQGLALPPLRTISMALNLVF